MSKLFNSTNNATINNQAQDTDQSNKLGWIKTGALIVGGTAAAVGAAIGAKKLYELLTDPAEDPEAIDYGDEVDEGSGMEDPEPSNETEASIDPETDFMEVQPESNSDNSIFVSAEELVDTKDTPSVPKPELDENGNFRLPKGKSWNDLVRDDLIGAFKGLNEYITNVTKEDIGDPIWVIRSSVTIFEKANSFADKTAWEDAYIESMHEKLDLYIPFAMMSLETEYKDAHHTTDIIYARRLYDEYLASPSYNYSTGKALRNTLENIENELQRYKVLKYSPAPEKDELDEELESSEDSKGESEEAPASDSSVPSTPAEEDAAKDETAASSEQTREEDSSPEPVDEPENPEVMDQFKKDMNFLGGLMKSGKYAESQKFFRENLSSYLADSNISAETRSALEQVQHQITNFSIAEKQVAAIEEANNYSHRTKKRGGKKNYKKNGRR